MKFPKHLRESVVLASANNPRRAGQLDTIMSQWRLTDYMTDEKANGASKLKTTDNNIRQCEREIATQRKLLDTALDNPSVDPDDVQSIFDQLRVEKANLRQYQQDRTIENATAMVESGQVSVSELSVHLANATGEHDAIILAVTVARDAVASEAAKNAKGKGKTS